MQEGNTWQEIAEAHPSQTGLNKIPSLLPVPRLNPEKISGDMLSVAILSPKTARHALMFAYILVQTGQAKRPFTGHMDDISVNDFIDRF